ncbi:hypothetical protein [Streptomyces nojiriensis]|uniref:hypothetical protein n=1 Tax=Streptomyces nojiriensis TaxID=66374 RepID=UPI00364D5401
MPIGKTIARFAIALGVCVSTIAVTETSAFAQDCRSAVPGSYFCDKKVTPNGYIMMYTGLGSDHHEYAYYRAYGDIGQEIWFDRSTNPKVGWDPYIYKWAIQSKYYDSWSDVSLYDGPPYKVRACTWTHGDNFCTAWH